jgi:hypothetical protein
VTSEGVRPAREGESRVTVVCIHNATRHDEQALLEMSTKTAEEMSKFLASPDVAVTNKKDKVTMLPIVGKTDEHVREMMSGMHSVIPESREGELREDDSPIARFIDSARYKVGSLFGVNRFKLNDRVECRDRGESWQVGTVVSVAPLQVRPDGATWTAGHAWDEVRVLSPPPGLKLEGGPLTGDRAKYLGKFLLVDGKLVNGRPAWQHTVDASLWLAFDGARWMGQVESRLGQGRGDLQLSDAAAASPDAPPHC